MPRLMRVVVAVGVLLVSSQVLAAEAGNRHTWGKWNGRAWIQMTRSSRIAYVTGVREGMSALATDFGLHGNPAYKVWFCSVCTSDEVVDGVTAFYEDPAHKVIPVVNALRFYVMKTKGASQDEVNGEVRRLLRRIAESSK